MNLSNICGSCASTGQAARSTNEKQTRRGTLASVGVLMVLLPWSSSSSGQGADQDVRSVDAIPVISGAVLADRFDQQEVDRRIWHRPDWLEQHNPYIAVEPEHGWLHLSGISRASGESFQYVGLISNNFRETDVVLAARMRVRSAFEKEGRIQHIVHLCTGDWPDFFTEVAFGKISSGPPVWSSGYINRVFDFQDTANRGLEKGLAGNDVTHNLVMTWVYELPFGKGSKGLVQKLAKGWMVGAVASYRSGTPLGIGGGPDLLLFNGGNRPNRVPGTPERASLKGGSFDTARDVYVNINAFSEPAACEGFLT
jgi:hypothetical protein